MSFNPPPLRNEIDWLTREQLLPIFLIMVVLWVVCAVEWTQRLAGQLPDPRFWTLLSLLVTVYAAFRIFRLRLPLPGITSDFSGDGEVANILRGIRPKGFVTLHDFRGDDRKIDHVVVGPSGIYAIETKKRSGSGMIEYGNEEALVFAGRIKDGLPLRHARDSASVVQSRLDEQSPDVYTVKALLVISGNWEIRRAHENPGVEVTTAARLAEYFEMQRPELSSREIAQISSYLQTTPAAA